MDEYNGKEIDDDFRIIFFVQKYYSYDNSEISYDPELQMHCVPTITMSDMKQLVGYYIGYDPECEDNSVGAIIMDTIEDHIDELLDGKLLSLKLNRVFGIRAQSSNDRYSWGYGKTHTFYMTHIEISSH